MQNQAVTHLVAVVIRHDKGWHFISAPTGHIEFEDGIEKEKLYMLRKRIYIRKKS